MSSMFASNLVFHGPKGKTKTAIVTGDREQLVELQQLLTEKRYQVTLCGLIALFGSEQQKFSIPELGVIRNLEFVHPKTEFVGSHEEEILTYLPWPA